MIKSRRCILLVERVSSMCEVFGLKSQNHKWRLKRTPRKTECGETIEQEENLAKQQTINKTRSERSFVAAWILCFCFEIGLAMSNLHGYSCLCLPRDAILSVFYHTGLKS